MCVTSDQQAFSAYSRVFLSSSAAKQRTLRKQVLEDKAQLAKTSSQDEFAKWAKLRRKVDKGLADLEKTSECLIPPPPAWSGSCPESTLPSERCIGGRAEAGKRREGGRMVLLLSSAHHLGVSPASLTLC